MHLHTTPALACFIGRDKGKFKRIFCISMLRAYEGLIPDSRKCAGLIFRRSKPAFISIISDLLA